MRIKMQLLTRMLTFFLLPAILGLVIISGVNFYLAKETINKQARDELSALLSGQMGEMSNIISMLNALISSVTEMQAITQVMAALENSSNFDPKNPPPAIAALLPAAQESLEAVVKNFNRIGGAGLINKDGIAIAHTKLESIGMNLADRKYFIHTMQGNLGFENVQSRASGDLSTIMSAPVKVDNKILGVIYIVLDLKSLATTTVKPVKMANSGASFVYDSKGILLMHPDDSYMGHDDAKLPWVKHILESNKGFLDYTWNDIDKIAVYERIPGTDWTVVVSVSDADVQAPIVKMLKLSSLLVIGISCIVGLIIYLVARGINATLMGSAHLVGGVAKGNFLLSEQEKALLNNDCERGDAIGDLAIGIKGMIENLNTLFSEAAQKTKDSELATQKAELATQKAEQAQQAAEKAKSEGMLAAAQQLEQVAHSIDSSAKNLHNLIASSEEGTRLQSRRISETAVAMEEMNSTVIEVSRSASETSGLTANTRTKAQEGAMLVENSIKSIQQVQQDSLELMQDMTALGENTKAITQIMSVISDIADQTNLLALNAAIEAARAGDAGRGFAVVADEVRKLAEKTMASTGDVDKAIKSIQTNTKKSITQVETAVTNIEQTTNQSITSGTALKEIVDMMETTSDQIRAIATASEEQSATSEEINRSISEIDKISQETANSMHTANIVVADMSEQATILNKLILELKKS